MGTVHARVAHKYCFNEDEGGLFDFDDNPDLDDEEPPPAVNTNISLNSVKARVDRVHVDGLYRTKDDVIRNTVGDLFKATDFEDVIVRAHKARQELDSLGCFGHVCVFIDVSSGPDATPDGLEVTFQVRELSRVAGGVNAAVTDDEGSIVLGVKLPNVFGRGERAAAAYSLGLRNTSNFNLSCTKPMPLKPYTPVLSASLYQQNREYPWSGYRLLDRGLLLDVAFKTSPTTKHTIQWEGLVREMTVLNKTSFKIRESSGPHLKSMVRHVISMDHRDEAVFPTRGTWVQVSTEVAGLGGGVANVKTELHAQANHRLHDDVVLQATGALGVLHDVFGTELPDHFFLGGPTSVRGFQQRGVGPHNDGQALGGRVYWASGVHLYAPLPVPGARSGLGALFRSHLFLNAGALALPGQTPTLRIRRGTYSHAHTLLTHTYT
ncbi:sorting and assembly machinery component 50 homolog A-like [Trichoplusia ni]|uniref:Sorting and assembly machinery component 50 homolog A-like n=1 Tax=Trichoplusia ni TaxID=7111 RepID=A0A7E5WZ13_TRINI|nr:sorting and assembly machinery component 50 homolog A-like [Trichoplusia ni]